MATATRAVNAAYDSGITFFDLADHYGSSNPKQHSAKSSNDPLDSAGRSLFDPNAASYGGMNGNQADHRTSSIAATGISSALSRLASTSNGASGYPVLHYPDVLVEPEEVAKAFDELRASAKVRHFGVSNYTAGQIE